MGGALAVAFGKDEGELRLLVRDVFSRDDRFVQSVPSLPVVTICFDFSNISVICNEYVPVLPALT